ncbi:hypothetical protein Raf01_94570 [Rugosimonospora africana]|uniref:Uncharacterized protein n=1 Tax=Rugosimonospora africana TaxID=556532 RepID=A0A8J3R1J4_9ACTN|nr:hypothetical protein Raf01_94570 [Rugosimonospora africana]
MALAVNGPRRDQAQGDAVAGRTQEIVTPYRNQESIKTISNATRITQHRVRRSLIDAGLTPRGGCRPVAGQIEHPTPRRRA